MVYQVFQHLERYKRFTTLTLLLLLLFLTTLTTLVIDFILQVAFLLYELVLKLLATRFKYEFVQLPFDLDTKYPDLLFVQTVFWLAIYFSPFLGVFYTNLLSPTRLTSFTKVTILKQL